MCRTTTWSFVHVSLKLCVTVEVYRYCIVGKIVPVFFLVTSFFKLLV